MKFMMPLAVMSTLLSATVLIQAAAAAPPSASPTLDQCNQGYKRGMHWTHAKFVKVCAELKKQDKS